MRTSNRKAIVADGTTNGSGERKDRVVHARFSAAEYAAVEHAAASAGMSISAFLRSLSLEGAGVLPFLSDEDRAVLDMVHHELRAIGVNLNGLVRVANRATGPDRASISEVVTTLRPALSAVAAELERYSTRVGQKRRRS
jgi:hypothetical protein